MAVLYSAVLSLMRFMLPLAAWFVPGAGKYLKVRRNVRQQIINLRGICGDEPILWFHCASLGEFEMAVPVLEQLRAKGKHKLIVSFFSSSGFEARSSHPLIDGAFYLPTDLPWIMDRTIRDLRPAAVFFVKYDFWYNLIQKLHAKGIPVYLLNGLLRQGHYILKPWAGWFRKQIGGFRHAFVQNAETEALCLGIGLQDVTLTRDLRFDRVRSEGLDVLERLENFKAGKFLLLAGSSWPQEELLLAEYLRISTRDIRIAVVPHDISEAHIKRICAQFAPYGVERWTEEADHSDKRVLVLDVVGLLRRAYKSADLVFIGGGFSGNVHNVLEAAAVGMPVLCGPHSSKFPEIQAMEQRGFLHRVRQASDIQKFIAHYIDNPDVLKNASHMCREFVIENQGATQRVMDVLEKDLYKSKADADQR